MELIYMYLGNIKRPLQNQGIHFGNKFLVKYDPESRELTIAKRSNVKPCIYGNHIESLDLLVGRNGTGKSTILDIFGLPRRNRQEVLPFKKDKAIPAKDPERYTWFALYHIRDNLFAAEGYWANMLKFLNAEKTLWPPFYSAAFRYDLENQRVLPGCQYLQFVPDIENEERRANENLFYVLYEPEGSSARESWYIICHRSQRLKCANYFLLHEVYPYSTDIGYYNMLSQ
ncbi:MAG: ATP-binding protein [Lachnospiraceae bacterium]|nr:ATP-binding protein [Lachnospiraceae bacterium]